MVVILVEITGPKQSGNPYYIPHLVEYITSLILKAKSFRNIVTQQKPTGGYPGSVNLPLYHGWGVTLLVQPRV